MHTLNYSLHFHGDMHIGSGTGIPGVIDERVLRDDKGFAYLPASTIKGLVRQSCIDLLRYRNQVERLMCIGQQRLYAEENEMPKQNKFCQDQKSPCLICFLFGSPVIKGATWYSPAEYPEEYREVILRAPFPAAERDMSTSAHASIDSRTGRAREHQLFNLEVVQPAEHFTGTIRLTRPLPDPGKTEQESDFLGWLTAALLFTRSAGGRRRRGWGQCQFILSEQENTIPLQALHTLLGGVK